MRKTLNLYSLFFIALLLIGCGKSKNKLDVFYYNESKGISTLDPAFARSQTIIWPTHQLFNGLVQFDSALNIIPCIAKSWTISENGLLYTFMLRSDVYFHTSKLFKHNEDRLVKSKDFIFSFNRIMNPKIGSPGKWVFNYLDTTYGKNGCLAVNDTILKLKLKQPFVPFISILGMTYCSVVPKNVVDYYNDDFGHHPIGTGPFYLKYWNSNQAIVLRKNKQYFETDSNKTHLPYLEGVKISFVADKQSEFMEFMLGNIDFISGINAQYKDALLTASGVLQPSLKDEIYLQKCQYLNTEYLGFNLDSSSGNVVPMAVRMALNYCFDRKQISRYMRNNLTEPAFGGIVPQSLIKKYSEFIKGFNYDIDKAKKIMSEAGYKLGYPKEIELFTTSDYVDICQYIQFKAKQIGVTININLGTGASFRNIISSGKAEMFRASWVADYPDAENYLSLFYSKNKSPNGPNYTRLIDNKIDNLYLKITNSQFSKCRDSLIVLMENKILENCPIIPLYYDNVVRFVQKNVRNFKTNPLNLIELKYVNKHNY